jgi:hypothetical protein
MRPWAEPEPACLVIADLTGYTGYLAGVELDHAQDVLADLVDAVVGGLRPTFRLAKLEGDAAFAYLIAEALDGSHVQDVVERTYVAFRRRLRDIARATRCACNACVRIPNLDLKFVLHHGLVVRQRVAGREELVGRDVILVHRLLKNAVSAATGIGAYAFYTSACLAAMGVEDPGAQGLRPHHEDIETIGPVDGWVRDLEDVWRRDVERDSHLVPAERAYWVHRYRTAAPPAVTWQWVTSPIRRPLWAGMDRLEEEAPGGRRGAGTVNHCVHGKDAIVEEILDWHPFEQQTVRSTLPTPGAPRIVMSDVLRALPGGGTEVELRVGAPTARDRAAFEKVFAAIEPMIVEAAAGLVERLGEEVTTPDDSAPQPSLPVSARRHEREPVRAPTGTVDSGGSRSSMG